METFKSRDTAYRRPLSTEKFEKEEKRGVPTEIAKYVWSGITLHPELDTNEYYKVFVCVVTNKANYASAIAKKLRKTHGIVVYQLKRLVKLGLIEKEKRSKTQSYKSNNDGIYKNVIEIFSKIFDYRHLFKNKNTNLKGIWDEVKGIPLFKEFVINFISSENFYQEAVENWQPITFYEVVEGLLHHIVNINHSRLTEHAKQYNDTELIKIAKFFDGLKTNLPMQRAEDKAFSNSYKMLFKMPSI